MNRFMEFTRKFFLFLFAFSVTFSWMLGFSLNSTINRGIQCLYAVENLNLNDTKLATIPKDYQDVSNITFSANGHQVAYKVRKEGEEFVVVGNKAGKPYEEVADWLVLLSPDGQRVAYDGRRKGKEYLVLDGKEGRPYDDVYAYAFSPDGSVVVCEVKEGEKWFVLLSDRGTPRYEYIAGFPFFSPDSRLVFYIGGDREKGEQTIFATDVRTLEVKKARTYAWIGNVTLSGDGLRYAYAVKKEKVGDPALAVDGKVFPVLSDLALNEEKEGPLYDQIGSVALSSDGQRVAYVVEKEGKKFLVVSNWASPTEVKEYGPYDEVRTPVFSPDGSQIAYPVSKEGKWFVVSGASDGSVPHHEGKGYDWIEQPVFSPDGKKIAYPAVKDGKWCVVSGEWEGPIYDMVVSPIFIPDGSKIIYRARRGEGQRFIVIGDSVTGEVIKEGTICDEVWQPVISAAGKFACYGARIGRELWWKVYPVR